MLPCTNTKRIVLFGFENKTGSFPAVQKLLVASCHIRAEKTFTHCNPWKYPQCLPDISAMPKQQNCRAHSISLARCAALWLNSTCITHREVTEMNLWVVCECVTASGEKASVFPAKRWLSSCSTAAALSGDLRRASVRSSLTVTAMFGSPLRREFRGFLSVCVALCRLCWQKRPQDIWPVCSG